MAKVGLVGLLSMLMTSGYAADINDKVNVAKRDIKIMSSILQTSIAERLGSNRGRVTGSFLANQGLYFELSINNGFAPRVFVNRDGSVFSSNPNVPIPPPPPKPVMPVKPSLESDLSVYEQDVESLVEMELVNENSNLIIEMSRDELQDIERELHKATLLSNAVSGITAQEKREMREKQLTLRKKHHDLAKKASRTERELRAVERQIRDAELAANLGSDKKEAVLASLKDDMSELTKKVKLIQKDMSVYRIEAQTLTSNAKTKLNEKLTLMIKQYADVISEATCDFGGGLKSVEQGEHVTFYVNGLTNQYYVFKQEDIASCAAGRINAKTLLSKATIYSL